MRPLATDAHTGTTRVQTFRALSSYLQILLGPEELGTAIFPLEEEKLEKERLIAEIVAARRTEQNIFDKAMRGVKRIKE